jgi:hypothetical protein
MISGAPPAVLCPSPAPPVSLQDTGLPEADVVRLILKTINLRGEISGQALSESVGLCYSVIDGLVEALKAERTIQVKRSLGFGSAGMVLSLSEAGRLRARESLEINQYIGRAPVPLKQHSELVRAQRLPEGWLTREALDAALAGMILGEEFTAQMGPAVGAADSLLLYGQPGDGKTSLVEALARLETRPIYVPYAIECQGSIIQVFDPAYHQRIEEDGSVSVILEPGHDARWVKCRRPFLVTGGELTMDMLDLKIDRSSGVYEAPFQIKANNGIYLIDDFGRQQASPTEVLNRWIVPMERRVDYLKLSGGGKMKAPFETFLVFSTNLGPDSLGDEAFLRRIRYKLLLPGPSRDEFIQIFERCCSSLDFPFRRDLAVRLLDDGLIRGGRYPRRCHPRDILRHAADLIRFEKKPWELTEEVMDRAFRSCFVESPCGSAPPARRPEKDCGATLDTFSDSLGALRARLSGVRTEKAGLPAGPPLNCGPVEDR